MCTSVSDTKTRCDWVTKDPLYISYHDTEWGKPQYDSIQLFQMLCLEGQQAGLSWLTVLKKRDNYRKVFHNFNPYKVAKLSNKDILKISSDSRIIRNSAKIAAIVNNAKAYVLLENEGENFSDFIWDFVKKTPVINNWKNNKEVPTQTTVSVALSKSLKKKGFKFVGPTICYAFMQACGLVDDHISTCFLRSNKDVIINSGSGGLSVYLPRKKYSEPNVTTPCTSQSFLVALPTDQI